VDAITGAPRRMHTVIAELCTGCELCVAPCPVDCIIMIPLLASPLPSLTLPPAQDSRARYDAHNERVSRRAALRAETLAAKKRGARPAP
jgi:electron transport complex protein RnfB